MTYRRLLTMALLFTVPSVLPAQESGKPASRVIVLKPSVRMRCIEILRKGLRSQEFWPSIHAAEALTVAGRGDLVRKTLEPKLITETDLQHRCGIARELVRAGDFAQVAVLLDVLNNPNKIGHTHAAESLYKVSEIGDGRLMRKRFAEKDDLRFKAMAAAALGRCGNPAAMRFLRKTLDHPDIEISRLAAWVLARIGNASDIPRLRAGQKRASDPIGRSYFQNALAALGDAGGQAALLKNLSHSDPAVRTYAAVFSGEARLTAAAESLLSLLDDSTLDVRIRAAQSLLVLSKPAGPDRSADISRNVFQATAEHPRYTEGSIIRLRNGTLLFATTQFFKNSSDFAAARIVARTSKDGGRTWGKLRVLQENVGGNNVMSVTLRRLTGPTREKTPIGLFYLVKNSFSDLHVYLRISHDEGHTFGPPKRVTGGKGYHVMNNDRVTRLSTGRLLVPVSWTADVRKSNHFVSFCYLSDDGGRSWRRGRGEVDQPKRGAMEPEVIELRDSRVLMIVRTQLGVIAAAYSDDGGDSWGKPSALGIKAPEAPATLRRIPATGDLVLIWNNTFRKGTDHGGLRTPLTATISSDEGRTWKHIRNLETRSDRTYSYTSLQFVGDRAVLSYWVADRRIRRYSSRFRSLPVRWFYAKP